MKNMTLRPIQRVLLVFPPIINTRFTNNICTLPMGIAALAACLRDRVEVAVLDAVVEGHNHETAINRRLVQFGLSYEEIQDRVAEFRPDLLGVSTIFSHQFPAVREIVRRAKLADPELLTVAGGTHPSFLPERCLQSSELDFIIRGEGEIPLLGLLEAVNAGKSLGEVPGLHWRENGNLRRNPDPAFIENLDDLPLPARDLFPIERYFEINLPMQGLIRYRRNLSVFTSRGCPYRCAFCSSTIHWGSRLRNRSVESVLAELQHLKERYGLREIKFEDDNLTYDLDRAKQLFRGMIERQLNLAWNTPNGIAAWRLDEEVLELMKRSGCYELTLAVESGDPEVLKNLIQKPLRLEQAREAARRVRACGIETSGYFIFGFPGETKAQIQRTFDFARELKLDRYYFFLFTPLPGTRLAQQAEELGLLEPGFDFESANNYFLPSCRTQDLSARELRRLQRREFWKQNLRLLFRSPWRFFKKYSQPLRTHPEFMLKLIRALFQ